MNKKVNTNTKSINIYQAVALYIAAILGSGVLFLSGSTAAVAGPASIISWIILRISGKVSLYPIRSAWLDSSWHGHNHDFLGVFWLGSDM